MSEETRSMISFSVLSAPQQVQVVHTEIIPLAASSKKNVQRTITGDYRFWHAYAFTVPCIVQSSLLWTKFAKFEHHRIIVLSSLLLSFTSVNYRPVSIPSAGFDGFNCASLNGPMPYPGSKPNTVFSRLL